ncbi:MAG: cupin domain-containing protein [Candidatus Brocadiia bacterium]|nr:MAG: cupin domain-containing protein [Candidatus Brocadiia bacterium]
MNRMGKKAFVVELSDKAEYQRLIAGSPDTYGLKSGRVYLEAGKDCGEHGTEEKEEMLIFLAGHGQAMVGGEVFEVGDGKVCYIPPRTKHNIINTGDEPLIYIFCVVPLSGC